MNIEELDDYVRNNSYEEIIKSSLNIFFYNEHEEDLDTLIERYNAEVFRDITEEIDYFTKNIQDIKANWQEYRRIFEILSDEVSKNTFLGLIQAKLTLNTDCIQKVYSQEKMYFNDKIFGELSRETYLDCGAYTGDSILKFIQVCPDYNKIHAFEAMPQASKICNNNLKEFMEYGDICLYELAVSDRAKESFFDPGNLHGDSKESVDGKVSVSSVSLDNCITDVVTFIKMDIEGGEKAAIEGAKRIIKEFNPKMAICIYHLADDFWKIPQLIHSINLEYDFAIRHHDAEVYSETILYCIPKKEMTSVKKDHERDFYRIANNLLLVQKKLVFYAEEENANIIQHVKDKKWFLKQLRQHKNALNSMQLKERERASELEHYVHELLGAKEWLEGQVNSERVERENLTTNLTNRITELEVYIDNLLQGKQWLENHVTELNNWVKELEAAKEWLGTELDNEKIKNEHMKAKNDDMQIKIDELQNEVSKNKYKLNVLLGDEKVKKIIHKKKYDV